jgi:hypothetical protein
VGSRTLEKESEIARVVEFEILKASRRKAAQVVIFKDTQKIFTVGVDNFVRKYPNVAGDYCPRMLRTNER